MVHSKVTSPSIWFKLVLKAFDFPLFQFPVLSNMAKKGAKKAAAEAPKAMKAMKAKKA